MIIGDGLRAWARARPTRAAVVLPGAHCTYAELAAAMEAVADGLRTLPGQGRPVGLLMPGGSDLLAAFHGCAVAGRPAMVLQPSWSDRELTAALELGQPALTLAGPVQADRVRRCAPGAKVVAIGEGVVAALERERREAPASTATHATVDPATPFYIGFTSGTTGRPKGYSRDHRSWLASFDVSAALFGIGATDEVMVPGPLEHSLFLYAAVDALAAGATVHLQRRFAPRALLRALAEQGITRLYAVPTMVAALARAAAREGSPTPVTSVRSVICSGARWPPAARAPVEDLFPRATAHEFYGASELSFVAARAPHDPPGSVGRPVPGVEVALRDERGRPVRTGEEGRLWVRSDMLFTGYLDAADDAAVRDPAGWVTVGDMARQDAAGRLYLRGRAETMLVCGGLNVYPEEIEEVLAELPQIAEAAVVGVDDPYWGQAPCAVVRFADGLHLPRGRLRDHCQDRLGRGKRPQRWVAVDDFPRTRSGKIARAALADGLQRGTLQARRLP